MRLDRVALAIPLGLGLGVTPGSAQSAGASRIVAIWDVHGDLGKITARWDDQVWAVDIGMSRAYGGQVQVLEIVNDRLRGLRP